MKVAVSVSLSEELVNTIDLESGLSKRSTFIEHLLRLGLEVYNEKKVEDTPINGKH